METTTAANYANEIRDFIVNNFLFGEGGSLQDDASLIQGGIIDSTGVLELITFLETKYNFKVEDKEMLPENLDSVSKVAKFLAGKLKSPPTVGS